MRWLVMLGLVATVRADAAPDDKPGERPTRSSAEGAAETIDRSSDAQPVSVTSRLDGTTAMFAARYVFHDVAVGPQSSFAEIVLPENSVVSSAAVVVGGTRHALALGHAAELADGFEQLSSAPTQGEPARAVIIRGREAGQVTVDVALPASAYVELELAVA